MSLITQRTLVIALSAFAVAACADAPTVDQGSFEEPALAADKADGVDYDNWTYIRFARQDMRRCMAPMCGGIFVARANQSKIKCSDGKWAKECYVAQYDFSAIAQGEEAVTLHNQAHGGRLLVRGELKTGFYPEFPEIAVLAVTEAWSSATEAPANGIYYKAHDLGIMCITSPCVSTELTRLNRNAEPMARVAGIDLTAAGASDDQVNEAWQHMYDRHIVVVGTLKKVTGMGGSAQTMIASQFFTRVVSTSAIGKSCGGRAGACPEGQGLYCEFENDPWCGAADGQGTCQTMPTMCTEEYEPVCGCDGMTYSNDCYRKALGAGHGTPGECEVPIDDASQNP